MPLPPNTLTQIGSTTYVQEPTLIQIVADVQAACTNAGHPEWLPATITRTIGSTSYIDTPKLADLEQALRLLGATGPADTTLSLEGAVEIQGWSLEQILAAARSLGL